MMKVIRTDTEYHDALESIEKLMDRDPDEGTPDADKLEVLTLLVEDYESKKFPTSLPGPVEAIKFRMEQQNLAQRDLIPYIGSRGKVSEVLSGKRTLTLSMMRALHANLGIPAKVLLQALAMTLPVASESHASGGPGIETCSSQSPRECALFGPVRK